MRNELLASDYIDHHHPGHDEYGSDDHNGRKYALDHFFSFDVHGTAGTAPDARCQQVPAIATGLLVFWFSTHGEKYLAVGRLVN
jgi:hypothetical protein